MFQLFQRIWQRWHLYSYNWNVIYYCGLHIYFCPATYLRQNFRLMTAVRYRQILGTFKVILCSAVILRLYFVLLIFFLTLLYNVIITMSNYSFQKYLLISVLVFLHLLVWLFFYFFFRNNNVWVLAIHLHPSWLPSVISPFYFKAVIFSFPIMKLYNEMCKVYLIQANVLLICLAWIFCFLKVCSKRTVQRQGVTSHPFTLSISIRCIAHLRYGRLRQCSSLQSEGT